MDVLSLPLVDDGHHATGCFPVHVADVAFGRLDPECSGQPFVSRTSTHALLLPHAIEYLVGIGPSALRCLTGWSAERLVCAWVTSDKGSALTEPEVHAVQIVSVRIGLPSGGKAVFG